MGLQSFYPVFANGQVLTSAHLNDIVTYLEPQDRLSRTRLTGIGVVCGLHPVWDGEAIRLSGGVAITSDGYLISEAPVRLDRLRDYHLPQPEGRAEAEAAAPPYPFLMGDDGQIPVQELLAEDARPGADTTPVRALDPEDLKGRVVMLFLEALREDLKSCDINDCSDRGAQMNFTLRRLLIDRADAARMLEREQGFTPANVHRAAHGRLDLPLAGIEKVNPSGAALAKLEDYYARLLGTAAPALSQVAAGLDAGFAAYRPVLADLYPADRFPQGPVPAGYFLTVLAQLAQSPLQMQSLHELAATMVRAHNEFVTTAARFDAECTPDRRRFPLHVLLGGVQPLRTSFDGAPDTMAEAVAFDPQAITGGAAPESDPRPFRHYFVPSEALDDGSHKRAELRALFVRAVLLAQSFHTTGMMQAPLKITPSRDGGADLGDRAIPAHLSFADPEGDLLANWSIRHARELTMGTIQAYQRTPTDLASHPLRLRRDGDDFLRIEGHLGKPLGTVLADIYDQRQNLGLNFAVDPVYVGPANARDDQAPQRALAAVGKLLLCRLRDLDVIFLMLMAGLIAFLVWLVQQLARLDAGKAVGGQVAAPDTATPTDTGPATARPTETFTMATGSAFATVSDMRVLALDAGGSDLIQPMAMVSSRALRLTPDELSKLEATTAPTITGLREGALDRKTVIETLTAEATHEATIGQLYRKARDPGQGGDLVSRLALAARNVKDVDGAAVATDKAYPAVALMAQSEELIAAASAPSLAEFDADRFGTAISGFSDAYGAYAAVAETDSARIGAQAAKANTQIVAAAPQVNASAARFGGSALSTELRKRLLSMFTDMTLPGYARRHPGMEHKGGVPVGGTFVLLYGDRAVLQQSLDQVLEGLDGQMRKVFSILGGLDGVQLDTKTIAAEFDAASRPQLADPLDQFTVLGDFCHDSMCCDGDCGDDIIRKRVGRPPRNRIDFGDLTELRPEVGPRTAVADTVLMRHDARMVARGPVRRVALDYAPAVLRGQAWMADPQSGARRAAKWAVLRIVDAMTGHEDRRDRLRDGAFNVELPPGSYEVQVLAEDRSSGVQKVDLTAGQTLKIDFQL